MAHERLKSGYAQRGKMILWALVPMLCAVIFGCVILPLWQQGRTFKNKTAVLKNRQQQLQLFARRYDAGEAGKRQQLLETLQKKLPEAVSTGEWLKKLETLADRSGIHITAMRPLPVEKGKGCVHLPFTISLEGSYTQLLLFFQLLDQDGQMCCMKETNVETENQRGHLVLRTKLYVTALKQVV